MGVVMFRVMDLAALCEDYDWQQAFEVATVKPVNGYTGSLDPCGVHDVALIVCFENGENDGDPWRGAFQLKDGRFVFVRSWCDYTGWDCQSGGDIEVADSLASLIQWAMTTEERRVFGVSLPGDADVEQ